MYRSYIPNSTKYPNCLRISHLEWYEILKSNLSCLDPWPWASSSLETFSSLPFSKIWIKTWSHWNQHQVWFPNQMLKETKKGDVEFLDAPNRLHSAGADSGCRRPLTLRSQNILLLKLTASSHRDKPCHWNKEKHCGNTLIKLTTWHNFHHDFLISHKYQCSAEHNAFVCGSIKLGV